MGIFKKRNNLPKDWREIQGGSIACYVLEEVDGYGKDYIVVKFDESSKTIGKEFSKEVKKGLHPSEFLIPVSLLKELTLRRPYAVEVKEDTERTSERKDVPGKTIVKFGATSSLEGTKADERKTTIAVSEFPFSFTVTQTFGKNEAVGDAYYGHIEHDEVSRSLVIPWYALPLSVCKEMFEIRGRGTKVAEQKPPKLEKDVFITR